MIEVTAWMNKFLKALDECFKERVWFVGLQGSYRHGEATETSDIDMVVILDELLLLLDEVAVNRAIKIGICNIYHGCVHNMLYEKSEEILKGLYKSASFTIQAICFKQTGSYIRCQKDLLNVTSIEEKAIVQNF